MDVTAWMSEEAGPPKFTAPMPPHVQLHDFLPAEEHRALVDWVMAREERFRPARVNRGSAGFQVDADMRIAATTRELGELGESLQRRLLDALPDIRARAGIGGPMPDTVELELAAHGDGAHYAAHLDTLRGPDGKLLGQDEGEVRLLSAVYYFHNAPKRFSGGALRLYRIGCSASADGAERGNHIDLEPLQNSLVVFPSWALHEVRPVSVPSGEFRDYRFAVNCWFCASLPR